MFTYIHGITWSHVADQPSFGEHWPKLASLVRDADFLVAHNAPFDKSVLNACCMRAGIQVPAIPFRCTVRLARDTWNIYPTRLPNVCEHLGIELQHHNALSDAEACARIVLEARRAGVQL